VFVRRTCQSMPPTIFRARSLLPNIIYVDGVCVATVHETPLKKIGAALAQGVTLEIGFGLGILHDLLHASDRVTEIECVELHPEIVEHYKTCDCVVHLGDYTEVELPTRKYDTILIDILAAPATPNLWNALTLDGTIWVCNPLTSVFEEASHGDKEDLVAA